MATKAWLFLEKLAPGSVRTAVKPNTLAAVALWRRSFELQEKDEEAKEEELLRALEEVVFEEETFEPIRSQAAVDLRREVLESYYRELKRPRRDVVDTGNPFRAQAPNLPSVPVSSEAPAPPSTPRHVIDISNLIPQTEVDESMFYPQ